MAATLLGVQTKARNCTMYILLAKYDGLYAHLFSGKTTQVQSNSINPLKIDKRKSRYHCFEFGWF